MNHFAKMEYVYFYIVLHIYYVCTCVFMCVREERIRKYIFTVGNNNLLSIKKICYLEKNVLKTL